LKKILVTGASGFIGQAISAELVLQGFDVLCAVRRPFLLDGASILRVRDLEEPSDWSSNLDGVDCIIHTAARVHIMDDTARNPFAEFHKVNVIATLNLAQQAASRGVQRFIFLSSIKVNGEYTELGKPFKADDAPNPQDGYSLSKHQAEQGLFLIAQKTGMEIVVIRPPLVYGLGVKANFASMMHALQRGIPLPFGAIHNKRSFVYIGNLVSLIVRCIDHPAAANQVFLVSDGCDFSTTELLNACATALGVKARLLPVPQSWIEYGASLLGKHKVAQRLCSYLQVDISKTQQYLDWTPPFSHTEGLKVTAHSTFTELPQRVQL
jgi:nucleoside-diphosphate-sugar epimerase